MHKNKTVLEEFNTKLKVITQMQKGLLEEIKEATNQKNKILGKKH